MTSRAVRFHNQSGIQLAGRLELPADRAPRAYAVYAHCFTCGKDVKAAVNIARALCMQGIAVLRFDFTGIGESGGEFADTTFSTNVDDIRAAAEFLAESYEAPRILIGHSLGGAATLEAAHDVASCEAVATIGAPANPEHVAQLLGSARETIEEEGEAEVDLFGRRFTFRKAFLDDLQTHDWQDKIHALRKPLLLFHSPVDRIVDISNAARIYRAAMHPKSFIALNEADHLLSNPADSDYVGLLLAAWASKYLRERGITGKHSPAGDGEVIAQLGDDGLRTEIYAGEHALVADEPESVPGGTDAGPSPYGYLAAALGACTAMTIQMYARRHEWPLDNVSVRLEHEKIYADDCADCDTREGRIDEFKREITLEGNLDSRQREKLLEIADKCPVHRTLKSEVSIPTSLADSEENSVD